MSFIWPSLLDFYVYGEPVFFFIIFALLIIPWWMDWRREFE